MRGRIKWVGIPICVCGSSYIPTAIKKTLTLAESNDV